MMTPHNLTDSERELLKNIINDLGLTQKVLSGLANVTQPWLSQVLNGRRESVDGEMLERVAKELAARLKSLPPDSVRSAEALNKALLLLGRFTALSVQPRFYRPGEAVPIDAANYLERDPDNVVSIALEELPFLMRVAGPVQCGKSSLLARLEQKAREKGIETARFDPLPPSSVALTARQTPDINAIAAIALSQLLQAEWGLERPRDGDFDTIPRLLLWLQQALKPTLAKPRLLIIDDLANLSAGGVEEWSSMFIRAMHNKISIAVGMTHHFGHNFARRLLLLSTVVHYMPKIELDWFDDSTSIQKDEATPIEKFVQSLANAPKVPVHGKESAEPVGPKLVAELFRGQPYLTHAAAIDSGFLKSVQRWTANSRPEEARLIREAHWYQRHLKAIRLAILGPTLEADSEARKLLETFVKICSGRTQADEYYPDYVSFLETARLIQLEREKECKKIKIARPKLSIYRLIAEDLAEFIGIDAHYA